MKFFVPIFALAFLFSACQPKLDHSAKIEQIDSTYSEIENSILLLSSIPLDSCAAVRKTVVNDIEFIQNNYSDSFDKTFGLFLNDYHTPGHFFKKIGKVNAKLKQELELGKSQLKDLKTDMTNQATVNADGNKMDEKFYQDALDLELNRVKIASENAYLITVRTEKSFNDFYEMKPHIDSLIQDIRANANP